MKKSEFEWPLIDRRSWRGALRRLHPMYTGKVKRVYPGTPEYHLVLLLRYEALVESGVIDPGDVFIERMAVPEDTEDIILAFFLNARIEATLTLRKPKGSAADYLITMKGGCTHSKRGLKGISLLVDTACIICTGLKRKALLAFVLPDTPPEDIYENWESLEDPDLWENDGISSHAKSFKNAGKPLLMKLDVRRYMPEGRV